MRSYKIILAVMLVMLVGAQVAFGATVKKAGVVRCPVTGEKVDPARAFAKTTYKGKTYYFCCAGCPDKFKQNPGKYSKRK